MQDLKSYSDQELWDLIRLDNREAFSIIYERHFESLYLFAYRVLQSEHAAEDIIHDLFSQLWIRRKSIFIESFYPYLKGTVRNLVFNHIRKGKISRRYLDSLEKVSFVDATEQMVNYNMLRERYESSLDKLPERCREVFLLSRRENMSVKEIAAKMGISPKTVENQITKALKHLREELGIFIILMLLVSV